MSRRTNTTKSNVQAKPAAAKPAAQKVEAKPAAAAKPAAQKVEAKPAAAAKSAAQKVEAKPAAAAKPAAQKVEAKPAAQKTEVKPAAQKTTVVQTKTEDTSSAKESSMVGLAGEQMEASAETIVSALNTLDKQLQDARSVGSDRVQEIVKEFGGENKITDLMSKLAGYMGEAAGAGIVAGMSPMIIMAGAAKGIYTKITK